MFFLARGVFFHIYYDVLCTFFLLLGWKCLNVKGKYTMLNRIF
jgi:hypothetical protein